MKNRKLHWLLREPKDERGKPLWTVEKIAEAIYCNRSRVTDTLNNKPGHGAQTRPKLRKFFRKHFPDTYEQLIESLGWGEGSKTKTRKVTRETFHVEQFED